MAEEKQTRPVWWTRQYLDPYTLTADESWEVINSAPWYCVVAWVTRNCEPVACAAAYVVMDGKIMLSSTANRDKVRAFRWNPAVSLCFQGRSMKQVTARGKIEINADPLAVRRWAVEHMATFERSMTEAERELQLQRYLSPDRVVLVAHIERLRSFDGEKMFRAEKQEQE